MIASNFIGTALLPHQVRKKQPHDIFRCIRIRENFKLQEINCPTWIVQGDYVGTKCV